MNPQPTENDRQQQTSNASVENRAVSKGFSEDWTSVIVGLTVLAVAILAAFAARPDGVDWQSAEAQAALIRQQESELTIQEEAKLDDNQRASQVKDRKRPILDKLGIVWSVQSTANVAKIQQWGQNPIDAFRKRGKSSTSSANSTSGVIQWSSLGFTLIVLALIGSAGAFLRGLPVLRFLTAFPVLFFLAVLAYMLASKR